MTAFILICALLAFLELDTTYFGQVMVSRPIVVGTILGLLCGDFLLGFKIGVFTELIYLDFMPIGGVIPPSGAISCGSAVILAQLFGMEAYFAFFVGILGGFAFSFIEKYIRKIRTKLLTITEQSLKEGKDNAGFILFQSLVLQFLAVYAFLLVFISLFGALFNAFSAHISEHLHIAFKFSYFVVPWIGLAGLMLSFSAKPKAD